MNKLEKITELNQVENITERSEVSLDGEELALRLLSFFAPWWRACYLSWPRSFAVGGALHNVT